MILPIYIETSDIVEQFNSITPKQIDTMFDNIAKGLAVGYARQLEIEAQNALHQTKRRYIENIRLVDTGRLEGTVLLDYSKDPLIKMLEEGADPFDMKSGFLKSQKVKYTKDGRRFLTIPFRLATPGSVATSDVFAGVMPASVYKAVKAKEANIPVAGGGNRSEGLKLGEIPNKYKLPETRSEIYGDADPLSQLYGEPTFKAYQHKTSIYQGLIKKQDSVTGQNTYHSFRRVSEAGVNAEGEPIGTDPDAFIHPGIKMNNLINIALNNFNQEHEVGMGLNIELAKLGFDVTE